MKLLSLLLLSLIGATCGNVIYKQLWDDEGDYDNQVLDKRNIEDNTLQEQEQEQSSTPTFPKFPEDEEDTEFEKEILEREKNGKINNELDGNVEPESPPENNVPFPPPPPLPPVEEVTEQYPPKLDPYYKEYYQKYPKYDDKTNEIDSDDSTPWYKKVHKFIKKKYHYIKDKFRG